MQKTHFGRWLKARREKLGYTQRQTAEEVGVTIPTIRNWEHSERLPRLTMGSKAALARLMRLSLEDLEAIGEGRKTDVPLAEPEPAPPPPSANTTRIANYTDAEHLLPHRELLIPKNISGGRIPHEFIDDPEAYCWIIANDSMEAPDGYRTGDVVLISPAMEPKPNDDVLVKLRGEIHQKVRRLVPPRRTDLPQPEGKRWLMLIPLNNRYPPDLVSEDEIESMHKLICIVLRCVGK